jgi:NAD(P)-dependent dehydrogenase (short-subunit alcohol dehydrogenase family)
MKNIIVTGASSGIGAKLSQTLSEENYQVSLLGRNLEKLNLIKKSCRNSTHLYNFDLTDLKNLKTFCSEWIKQHPEPLHGLILNAGNINRDTFFNTEEKEWENQFKISVLSPVILIKGLWDRILSDKTKIITVSSTLALKPIKDTAAYSSLKAAMLNWTQSLAIELAPHGISVNSVCPGIVQTPIHGNTDLAWKEHVNNLVPLGRPGEPEDIANFISFLLKENTQWITGSHHVIDGGLLNLK